MQVLPAKNSPYELYRAIFDNNGAAMLVFDSETVVVLANSAFAELSGYSRPMLENRKKWSDLFELDRAIIQPGAAAQESVLIDRNGCEIPVLLTGSPRMANGGWMVSLMKQPPNHHNGSLLKKYQLLFDNVRDIVFLVNSDGRIVGANRAAVQSYGYSREELQSMSLHNLRQSGPLAAVRDSSLAGGSSATLFEVAGLRKDGSTFQLEVNSCTANIMGETITISIGRDITERKIHEQHLHKTQMKMQALVEAIPDMLLRIGRGGTIHESITNLDSGLYAVKYLKGKSLFEILPRQDANRFVRTIKTVLRTRSLAAYDFKYIAGERSLFLEARLTACGDDEVVAIIRDITGRKTMEEQLRYMGFHDALTGVYNRAYFEQEMERLKKVRRVGAGIVMCDVDGLKLINDSLGHAAGDQVLKEVARIIKSCFRASDIVARIGGDEFAVLLQERSTIDCAKICKRISRKVARYNAESALMPIGLAIGYAVDNSASENLEELLKEADTWMYRQKLHHHESSKSVIVDALLKALQNRDHITEGHAERLEGLVRLLAEKMGIPYELRPDLALFARFHDIGKVGIPDQILFKATRLTEKEWAVMKQHSEIGYRIASSIPDLQPIAEWILYHHEWWNGHGYPQGLKELDIPLECRILTIADAFDAMTNNRPYHKAISRKRALMELERCAGTQFDPELVKLFIKGISRNGRT